MPDLIRFYIKNVMIGFALAALFVAGLLYWDVMGLWRLISGSPMGWIAAIMLFLGNGVIFAGVQFAVAILLMADDDDINDDSNGGPTRKVAVAQLAYAPVPKRRPEKQ